MKQSTFYRLFVLVNSIFAFHMVSAATTPLSNELVRLQAKNHSTAKQLNEPRIILNSSLPQLDQNDHIILKRDTKDRKSIGTTDLVKGTTYKKPTIKQVTPTKLKPKKTNDLIFDIVRQKIEEERNRRRYDLVHPQNSKFAQQEQVLWNKLRIKATADLLLHPKSRFQMPTERVFDTFKQDLEGITPRSERGGSQLFASLKDKLQKQFYLDKYSRMFGRTIAP